MSKRSTPMDDKTISEMILKNTTAASLMNVDMNSILSPQQMRLLTAYKNTYNYEPYLSFFLSLALMSHFSHCSFYTHFSSAEHRPVQLYLWLLGSSGTFVYSVEILIFPILLFDKEHFSQHNTSRHGVFASLLFR